MEFVKSLEFFKRQNVVVIFEFSSVGYPHLMEFVDVRAKIFMVHLDAVAEFIMGAFIVNLDDLERSIISSLQLGTCALACVNIGHDQFPFSSWTSVAESLVVVLGHSCLCNLQVVSGKFVDLGQPLHRSGPS